MVVNSTILAGLWAILALWSVILAGVATKSASELYKYKGRGAYQTLRNGSGLLAFDAFVTLFVAIGFAALFATGRGLPALYVLPVVVVLFLLWLGGAAAFSNGYDDLEVGRIDCDACGAYDATVAFAWLGWITLLALLVIVALMHFKGTDEHDGGASGGLSFSMPALRRNKATAQQPPAATDVEKAHEQPVAAGQPYPQQNAEGAMPVAAPGYHAADASANTGAGYHGQSPVDQPFSGAYGAPADAQHAQGAAPYDAAQAYAQQTHYEGQQPPAAAAGAMPQPHAPAGWSVSPLGSQPVNGAAPTAEIVAGEPRQ